VKWEVRRVKDWTEYTALIDTLNNDPTVKAIYPVALTLPVEGGGRYTAAQIYDWTISHSRKPEMAINYFFARMGLFGGAVINFGAMESSRARRAPRFSPAPRRATCRSRTHPIPPSSSISSAPRTSA